MEQSQQQAMGQLLLALTFASGCVARESVNTNLVPYNVVTRDATGSVKVVYSVEVDLVDGRLPSNQELGAISSVLRGRDRAVDSVFVQFFFPGMDVKSGAYAFAHHTPEPEEVIAFPERLPRSILEKLSGGNPLAPPTKYDSLAATVEALGGYSLENGTLVIHESGGVPHVEVSPKFVANDLPEVIEKEIRRAAVSVILSVFAHTDYDAIRVTVSRCNIDRSRRLRFDRKNPRVLTVGRTGTEEVIKRLTGGELHELFGARFGDRYDPDFPTQTFLRCIFDDQGQPTLARVYSELAALKQPTGFRQWTDIAGRFTTEAEFVGFVAGKIKVRKKEGQVIEVPPEKLSLQDQKWVAGRRK